MEPDKYYTIKYLVLAFKKVNLPHSETWFRRQETKGNLMLPRSTTNFKKPKGFLSDRKIGAVRMITGKQIAEIVKAFSPGGSGYWNYMDTKNGI